MKLSGLLISTYSMGFVCTSNIFEIRILPVYSSFHWALSVLINDASGLNDEDTPRSNVSSFSGGGAFEYRGTNTRNRFEEYMKWLGWTVDSNGKLTEGKRAGTDLEDFDDIRRTYFLYSHRRDITMGARFSF